MDIHKPKPIHGWRELAKEVGIIVLGVVIALGAEQGVAKLHELRLADDTRSTAARSWARRSMTSSTAGRRRPASTAASTR